MTKSDLITTLAQEMNISHSDASAILDTIFNNMSEHLADGGGIEIRGFGSFKVKEYDSYTGRNPKTGENINVNAKKLPVFKAGKGLADRVNGRT